MEKTDPRMLNALERLLRQRHERLADRKVRYRQCADRLEAARGAEVQAREAWLLAQAELAAAQSAMDEEWQAFERLSKEVDAEMREQLLAATRTLRDPE
jgi:hypothetical protein